ncbi:MAG: MFS transporter, partial [Rhodospirillales bacterium]|nr:MFS transporter [Rhodospirillales bacterium]
MQQEQAMGGGLSWFRGFSRYQWLVFMACWLGWMLDGTNFTLFAFVLKPAVTELVGGTASVAVIGKVGGYLAMTGLLGWAIGGFIFGTVADYIGRVRTLAISIAMYSVFTAMQGFSHSLVQLGIYRFLGGIGTGAELVVGIPLVAEAFAENSRARVLGLMMTGAAFGNLLAAQEYHLLAPYGWRAVFFAGIIPALLLLLIRRGMVEPERFAAVRARREALAAASHRSADDHEFMKLSWRQLFNAENRYSTMVGLMFATGTLLAIWTSQIWLPTIQGIMLHKEGVTGAAAIGSITLGMEMFGLGGIFGYASFGFLADALGRRPTIILYSLGTMVFGIGLYLGAQSWGPYPYVLPLFGFCVFGVFSGHAVYLPELFPTHMRGTAVAFCNGSGRLITSFGPLVAGLLVAPFGGNFAKAAAVMTGFA